MVVPLKLTQFYGRSLPRPRIYPDVKYNEHRVDPPASVNDALLSWASDAHWSMGGLSFKRLRAHGKLEGSVRRLRAFLEEDEDQNSDETVKSSTKVASLYADSVKKFESATRKVSSAGSGDKRRSLEEETVKATPARKLRRKMAVEEVDVDDEMPVFVPATEEISRLRGQVASVSISKEATAPGGLIKKRLLRSPANGFAVTSGTPTAKAASGTVKPKRKGKLSGTIKGSLQDSKGSAVSGNVYPEGRGGERLTRSAKKSDLTEGVSSRGGKPSRPRKILLASDGESSDDGLEESPKEKERPLRRSTRAAKPLRRSTRAAKA